MTTDEQDHPKRSLLDALLEIGEARGFEKGRQQGIQLAIQKCMADAVRTILEQMLQKRFGPVTPAVQQRLAAADVTTLQRWCVRLVRAANCDDVFAS